MNHLISLRAAAIAGLIFAAPTTGLTKDKHNDNHRHDSSDRGRGVFVQPHFVPRASLGYRSYGYRPYGYGYGYGYRPYYYSRPSISLGFYSAPAYYSTPDYDYDYDSSYSVRTYRGVPRASYRDSSSDDLAVDVQRALARRGFYRGGIDGDVGPGTRAAIRGYQYNHGLEVTGRIDGTLLRSLGIS
jgi:Putative peptidoglycan binding domain